MPRASGPAVYLATKVLTAGGTAAGTYFDQGAVEVLAAQIDVAADLIRSGEKATRTQLALMLMMKLIGLSDIASDDRIKCGGALIATGVSTGTFVASVAAAVGTAGGSTPLAYISGLSLLAELYSTWDDCKVGDKLAERRKAAEQSCTTAFCIYDEFLRWIETTGNLPIAIPR